MNNLLQSIDTMKDTVKNRYEFVLLFDVANGNPNGDPDAGNLPRIDPETNLGIVTDVCIKRKVRNFVELFAETFLQGKPGYNILVKMDRSLNSKFTAAYDELGLEKGKADTAKKEDQFKARDYMCKNYFDVRTFGAVMTTGKEWCDIVRGPVQFNFAQSIDPIFINELTITRQAVTKDEEFGKGSEMGKKSVVPYGLYRMEGYVSAMLAQKFGFTEGDLELLWHALINMFENDHSAARGKMAVRKLIIFKHESALGNAPSHQLFDLVKITKKSEKPARSFEDYEVTVQDCPFEGVSVDIKL